MDDDLWISQWIWSPSFMVVDLPVWKLGLPHRWPQGLPHAIPRVGPAGANAMIAIRNHRHCVIIHLRKLRTGRTQFAHTHTQKKLMYALEAHKSPTGTTPKSPTHHPSLCWGCYHYLLELTMINHEEPPFTITSHQPWCDEPLSIIFNILTHE